MHRVICIFSFPERKLMRERLCSHGPLSVKLPFVYCFLSSKQKQAETRQEREKNRKQWRKKKEDGEKRENQREKSPYCQRCVWIGHFGTIRKTIRREWALGEAEGVLWRFLIISTHSRYKLFSLSVLDEQWTNGRTEEPFKEMRGLANKFVRADEGESAKKRITISNRITVRKAF